MRAAVIGNPAGHSLSPAIHRAGYEATGLRWRYDAYTLTHEELDPFVQQVLVDPEWAGLSVTAPHKDAIVSYGQPDEVTLLVGAGNTLVATGSPRVYNTDVPGFVRAWRTLEKPAPVRVAIAGAGATTRSILVALAGVGTRDATLLVRELSRADDAVALGRNVGLDMHVQLLGEPVESVDLFASTIPATATGEWAHQWASVSGAVFDAVYDPWPTPVGVAAAEHHIPALNGLDLLAGQAVDQFFLLTGETVSFELLRSAAGRALAARSQL